MILERIKKYIDLKGISISAFEKSIGMSNASFGKSLKNGGAIGTDKLENILHVYSDLNPTWLLTGVGDILSSQDPCIKNARVNAQVNAQVAPSNEENRTDITQLAPIITLLFTKIDEKDKKIEEKDALIVEQAKNIGALQKEVEMLQKGFRAKGMDSIVSDNVNVAEHANVRR